MRKSGRLYTTVFAAALLAVLPVWIDRIPPAEAAGHIYIGNGAVVARDSGSTAADNGGGVDCTTGVGGACILWSDTGSNPSVKVVDDVAGTAVAFQVCVDNDGNRQCGGSPIIPGCGDSIVFSHFDGTSNPGTFSNPLTAPPKSFTAGCPGGFPGWVVIICDGAHGDGSGPHHHAVTSGTISDDPAAGGSSGQFCAGPPLAPGKPYTWPPAATAKVSAQTDWTSCDGSPGLQVSGPTSTDKCYEFSPGLFKVHVQGLLDGSTPVDALYDCSGQGLGLANPNPGDNNGFTGTFGCTRFQGIGPSTLGGSFAGLAVNNCCPLLFAGRLTHSGETVSTPYHGLYCQGQLTPTGATSNGSHVTTANFSGDCQIAAA